MEMLADCGRGKIDLIITKSISRFARNTTDCLEMVRKLIEMDVFIYFEKENINTMDSKGEVLLTIMASLAQQESESLSKNVKSVYSSKYALSSIVYCPKCGDIYRLIAWNNRGKRHQSGTWQQKQDALVEKADREGLKQRIEEMKEFLTTRKREITTYNEQMVRRLIEKITVYDEKFEVEFKSGTSVDVRR